MTTFLIRDYFHLNIVGGESKSEIEMLEEFSVFAESSLCQCEVKRFS